MRKQYYVYITTNVNESVLYTGVTSDLKKRIYEHKQGSGSVFTRRFKAHLLVYYEVYGDLLNAIEREKIIKGGSRSRKMPLIDSFNPEWNDLYPAL
jgi:putative endonuclease